MKVLRPREIWGLRASIARGTGIGSVIGVIPGGSAVMGALVAYGIERQVNPRRDEFGTGVPDGLAAPEASKNATTGTALIPLLSLGIPSTAASAIMLAALIGHGVQPGPMLYQKSPDMLYAIFASFTLANLFMILASVLVARGFGTLMRTNPAIICAFIIVFSLVGAFGVRNNIADVYICIAFGILGFYHAPLQLSDRADGAGRGAGPARRRLLHDLDGELRRRLDGVLHAAEERRTDGARRRFRAVGAAARAAQAAAARWNPGLIPLELGFNPFLAFGWCVLCGFLMSMGAGGGGILAGVGHISILGIGDPNMIKVVNQILEFSSRLVSVPLYHRQQRLVWSLALTFGDRRAARRHRRVVALDKSISRTWRSTGSRSARSSCSSPRARSGKG